MTCRFATHLIMRLVTSCHTSDILSCFIFDETVISSSCGTGDVWTWGPKMHRCTDARLGRVRGTARTKCQALRRWHLRPSVLPSKIAGPWNFLCTCAEPFDAFSSHKPNMRQHQSFIAPKLPKALLDQVESMRR